MARLDSEAPAVRTHMRGTSVRRGLALAATVLGVTLAAGALPALAGGGTVGDPQPELAKFKVGTTGGSGTGAVLPNNVIVLASPTSGGAAINVCTLNPGGTSCATKATLSAYKGGGNQDTFSGPIEVFATGGDNLSIVAYDCCYIGANGVTVFNSTDGGRTWGPQIQAGDLGDVGAATFASGNLVVATSLFHDGTQVQGFSPNPSIAQTSFAQASAYAGDTAISTYHGGVLVAEDNLSNTRVEYAPAGAGVNSTASYKTVGAFNNEETVALSGDALLTDPGGSLTSGIRLRFFNGASFGPAYKVPEPKNPDDGYFAEQVAGDGVHVFFIARRSGYDLMTETTVNGKTWTPLVAFSTAIVSDSLSPALNELGNGVVFENDGTPLYAQPILNAHEVHISISPSRVRVGHTATITGTSNADYVGANPIDTLEVLRGGAWYPEKTTRGQGLFHFTVAGVTATYRVVMGWIPMHFQYGYSNAATLVAVR
jgi:hypothetical protein